MGGGEKVYKLAKIGIKEENDGKKDKNVNFYIGCC